MFKKQPDIKLPKGDGIKGLVYDIETSPLICYSWDRFPKNGVIKVIEDYQILSIAWHWEGDYKKNGDPKIYSVGQDDFSNYKPGVNDDTEVVKFGRELLHNADYVVGHNSDQFDNKRLRARIAIRGFNPPSPYKMDDTKKMAKRVGGFTSNTLKSLAEQLGVPLKEDAGGFKTWEEVLAGNPKAWKHIKWYNEHDIAPVIGIRRKLRPHDTKHLALNQMTNNSEACPKCLGANLQSRGFNHTKTNTYRRFLCLGCGGWCQSRTPEKREKMLYV